MAAVSSATFYTDRGYTTPPTPPGMEPRPDHRRYAASSLVVAEPSVPRVRRAPLPDDAILVIRGDDLDPATSRRQAEAFRRRFSDWGRWGLSAFYARNDAEVDDLGSDQLERFSLLGCYRVVDLQKAGFEIWPTFRTPHVTIAFTGDLDDRLAALAGVAHEVRVNPYHESEDTPKR